MSDSWHYRGRNKPKSEVRVCWRYEHIMTGLHVFPYHNVVKSILIISLLKWCFPTGGRKLDVCFLQIKSDMDVHFTCWATAADPFTPYRHKYMSSCCCFWGIGWYHDLLGHIFYPDWEFDNLVLFFSALSHVFDRVVRNQHSFSGFLSALHFHLKMHYQHSDSVHMNVSVFLLGACVAVCVNWSDLETSGYELENS